MFAMKFSMEKPINFFLIAGFFLPVINVFSKKTSFGGKKYLRTLACVFGDVINITQWLGYVGEVYCQIRNKKVVSFILPFPYLSHRGVIARTLDFHPENQ